MSSTVRAYLSDPGIGLNTDTRIYRSRLFDRVQQTLGKDLVEVTAEDLARYFDQLEVSSGTTRTYRSAIKAFFKWATVHGKASQNPIDKLDVLRPVKPKPVKRHNWLSNEDVHAVLAAIDDTTAQGLRERVILLLGFTTGLRATEMVTLKWADVDMEKRRIHVVGKGAKLATVYITDGTAAALRRWREAYDSAKPTDPVLVPMHHDPYRDITTPKWGHSLAYRTFYRIVRDAGERAGVQLRPHDMRRTFAGLLHDRTNLEEVSKAMRHSNVGTTQVYLEKRQDAAAKVVAAAGLDFGSET